MLHMLIQDHSQSVFRINLTLHTEVTVPVPMGKSLYAPRLSEWPPGVRKINVYINMFIFIFLEFQ